MSSPNDLLAGFQGHRRSRELMDVFYLQVPELAKGKFKTRL
jgi:hypothetical protein